MGVHTGDSYCTAPMLTISPELQKRLQKYSYDIVEAIQVIGGTNVQFAHDPKTDRRGRQSKSIPGRRVPRLWPRKRQDFLLR